MVGNKLSISPIALNNQKPTDIKECYIELFESHVYYKMEFYADEPKDENDHSMGWESNVYNNYNIIALKKNIVGLERYMTKDKKWAVYIIVLGFDNHMRVYFKSETSAQGLFDKLQEWLLK